MGGARGVRVRWVPALSRRTILSLGMELDLETLVWTEASLVDTVQASVCTEVFCIFGREVEVDMVDWETVLSQTGDLVLKVWLWELNTTSKTLDIGSIKLSTIPLSLAFSCSTVMMVVYSANTSCKVLFPTLLKCDSWLTPQLWSVTLTSSDRWEDSVRKEEIVLGRVVDWSNM